MSKIDKRDAILRNIDALKAEYVSLVVEIVNACDHPIGDRVMELTDAYDQGAMCRRCGLHEGYSCCGFQKLVVGYGNERDSLPRMANEDILKNRHAYYSHDSKYGFPAGIRGVELR